MIMLPERLTRLLTAYVDGELRTHQRKAVMKLLRRSSQARKLLRQLQADAHALRSLPCFSLGRDLSEPILQRINGQPRRTASSRGPAIPSWYGLAAAVLLAVGLGSYLYYLAANSEDESASSQVQSNSSAKLVLKKEQSTNPRKFVGPPAPEKRFVKGPTVREKLPLPGEEKQFVAERVPLPEMEPDKLPLASQNFEGTSGFKKPDLKVALTLELRKPKEWEIHRQEVLSELKNNEPHHLDLSCLAVSTGMERLQAAFKAQGVRLSIDQDAQNQLKLLVPRLSSYALYVENVTPEEVVSVFHQLDKEDRETLAKHRGPAQFTSFILKVMGSEDHKNLAKALGMDPTQHDVPKSSSPLGVDIRKPLATDTEKHVVDSLKGQGPSRPEPGKQAKAPERLAIVVSWNPLRARSTSAEVKYFLNHRTERKPGTVQMLLILSGNKS
jgi:hypothetical protein